MDHGIRKARYYFHLGGPRLYIPHIVPVALDVKGMEGVTDGGSFRRRGKGVATHIGSRRDGVRRRPRDQ